MADDPPLSIDFILEADPWAGYEDALARALQLAAQAEEEAGSVAVLLADDAAIAALNQQFRDKPGPTNVLSFPPAAGEAGFLGDIALAAETIAREAENQGKSFVHHASHLVVHGFLHLLGYDHLEPEDAERMEARERAILAELGIEDPYA
ncbi:MAG TPA: rRNA maturation RNase YbeY [Terricaulis sp.]|nr:rRNA maturation RNase YbeY [Terricaulis sp.]